MEQEINCKCGGKMVSEDREKQYERIRNGLKNLFSYETDERIDEYTRNFIGYGPNYMKECEKCGHRIKFIPDGRFREYE